jgi:hypothetical protein
MEDEYIKAFVLAFWSGREWECMMHRFGFWVFFETLY